MSKYREYMKSRSFSKPVFFIVFTAVLLYITYFILRDFATVTTSVWGFFSNIVSAFNPLWIGLILAYIINPMVEAIDSKFISKIRDFVKKTPPEERVSNEALQHFIKKQTEKTITKTKTRILSIVITYIIIIAAATLIIYGFAAMILGQVIFTNLPDLFEKAFNLALSYESDFKSWAANLPAGAFSDYISEGVNTLFAWISKNFSASGVIDTVSGLSSSVLDFVLGVIVSIYLIADKDFFLGLWDKLLYLVFPHKNDIVRETLGEINEVLSSFIRGVLIDSVCVAVLSSIGLSIIGLKFAVFIGVFAGVANVIPYFGPVLGMVPAFLIGTFTDNLFTGLLALITLIIVQQIDANIIYPRVVGSSTGLKPLFVLLAVSAAGYYGGIMGMLVAVPVAGILQIFICKLAAYREAQIVRKEQAKIAEEEALKAMRAAEMEESAAGGSTGSLKGKFGGFGKKAAGAGAKDSAHESASKKSDDDIDQEKLEALVCKVVKQVIDTTMK